MCKFKAHKRCAVRATSNCKWTTLASIGKDIIEDEDGVCPGTLHSPPSTGARGTPTTSRLCSSFFLEDSEGRVSLGWLRWCLEALSSGQSL